MSVILIELLRALVAVGPSIVRAIRDDDEELAKRRAREALDRQVDVSLAKERLRKRRKKIK